MASLWFFYDQRVYKATFVLISTYDRSTLR